MCTSKFLVNILIGLSPLKFHSDKMWAGQNKVKNLHRSNVERNRDFSYMSNTYKCPPKQTLQVLTCSVRPVLIINLFLQLENATSATSNSQIWKSERALWIKTAFRWNYEAAEQKQRNRAAKDKL